MSDFNSDHWLNLLQGACTQASTPFIHLIIDQVGCAGRLLASVRSVEPPISWHSLYAGLPEEAAEDVAPLLVRIDLAKPLQRLWLAGLLQELQGRHELLALVSHWSFKYLGEHLTACLEATQGGHRGLLRYYDPRLFPLLFKVFDPEQQQRWLQPAFIWSWLDRDGQPQCLVGEPATFEEAAPLRPTELSDAQLETFGCASDATLAIPMLSRVLPKDWSAERRFQVCYAAMLEATREGLIADSQRLAFVRDRLHTLLMDQTSDPRKTTSCP
ncbi:DUF4123 domain-containing protein [Pseudomonas ovata]|uniref:DUF4123 domain-containing protein n=1 Tax=Pseudomonas ovata TaxID=1839709 RepID=UPI000D68D849|nr:DUF4123 domain-containing protein [Pseudomonas ovata]